MSASSPTNSGGPPVGCAPVGLISIALGVLCATVAWRGPTGGYFTAEWPGLRESLFSGERATVVGTVIRNEPRVKMAYPIVRYTVAGRTFEITGNGRSPAQFAVGDRVEVTYHPAAPERGRLVGFQQQYLPPLAILVVAMILVGIGVLGVRIAFERPGH